MTDRTDASSARSSNVAAIIVLYHPDREALRTLLGSLEGQVSALYVVDNTPGSAGNWLLENEQTAWDITYIPLGENRGLAEAQNIGIEKCLNGGFSHILLLDQDSALSPGMVNKLLAAEKCLGEGHVRVAAVVPQIEDGRTGRRPCAYRYRWIGARKLHCDGNTSTPVQTDFFIASGALIRTEVFRVLGKMRSDLLIDHVDTEWALRAHTAGYRSYCVPDATLIHNLGDGSRKILGKDVYLYSETRYYYRLRNEVYLSTLRTMGWRWRVYIVPMIPYHFVLYSVLSKNHFKTARLLMRAIWDGLHGNLGSLPGS